MAVKQEYIHISPMADINRLRLAALWVSFLMVTHLLSSGWVIPCLLVIEFGLRSLSKVLISPLCLISKELLKLLKLDSRPFDLKPVLYEARTSFLLSATLLAAVLFEWGKPETAIASVLLLSAFLESSFGFLPQFSLYRLFKKVNKRNCKHRAK